VCIVVLGFTAVVVVGFAYLNGIGQ
jgi:hypothetical protein